MKLRLNIALGVFALAITAALPKLLDAAIVNAPLGITAISVGPSGETYIRFAGIQNPGVCGSNNNWVAIPPTASASMKTLAETLYFNRRPVRVDTLGCFGAYERVVALYSPGG